MKDNYKYAGLPLSPAMASELAVDIFAGQTVKRQEVIDKVVQYHRTNGGLPSEAQDLPRSVKKALENLKDCGKVENPSQGFWRFIKLTVEPSETETETETKEEGGESCNIIEEHPRIDAKKIIGSGDGAVYIYFYSIYEKYAALIGDEFWPCKVGLSERDPLIRVLSQSGTALPEVPVIALLIKTDKPRVLENALHSILDLKGRRTLLAPGTEWFNTSPTEIEKFLELCDIRF